MSDQTLRSFFHLIASRRVSREAYARTMEQASPLDRPRWNMQIAVFDNEYRAQLDAIDELPDLLVRAPRLQEGWPYPSEDAFQVFRAELAYRTHRSVQEIDDLTLRDVIALLGDAPPRQNGPQALVQLPTRREITGTEMAVLPRWARVAFAARCARRVQRLLTELAPTASPDELGTIEQAVTLAEQSAMRGHILVDADQAATLASKWANSHVAVMKPVGTEPHVNLSDILLYAVGNAAAAAARSVVKSAPYQAYEAYGHATHAAHAVTSRIILDLMRRDFVHLETMAKKQNWTDQTPVMLTVLPQPRLRLVGLHIRGLRAIRQLDLPQDGLGWQGQTPPLILLAGVNGSGKTTLLNFLTDALALITRPLGENYDAVMPKWLDAQQAWADFELESYEVPCAHLRFIVGNNAFVEAHKTDNCWWIMRPLNGGGMHERKGNAMHLLRATIEKWFRQVTIPAAVCLSSEERTLIVPGESYKAAGKLVDNQQFVHRWQPPASWKDSPEAFLYSLRWEDLNVNEDAPFTQPSRFLAYADAFRRFTGESKYLKFEEGKLVVKIAGSTVAHDLSELSSGEKQVLLLSGELLRYWRPGSLILIDEPELHLHSTWQTKLYEALRYWQAERGGQVILATQSSHLFHTAEPGTVVLVGVDSL